MIPRDESEKPPLAEFEREAEALKTRVKEAVRKNGHTARVINTELLMGQVIPHVVTFIWAIYFLVDGDWFYDSPRFNSMERVISESWVWGTFLLLVGGIHLASHLAIVYRFVNGYTLYTRRVSSMFLTFFWAFVVISNLTRNNGEFPTWTGVAVIFLLSMYAMVAEWKLPESR